MKRFRSSFLRLVLALCIAVCLADASPAAGSKRPSPPNIVIILADDLGYSDLGAFGGEIPTPNIDALAQRGVRFTNFYTHASCSPTRAMLMTGVDTHRNGLGNMAEWTAPNQRGVAGYEGHLRENLPTLPELLRGGGYRTYMVGKWHLGREPSQIPAARGFDRDFALLDGAASYWDMTGFTAAAPKSVFTEDGRYLTRLPDDYYATKTYTDKIISFIEADRNLRKPFFALVAHQAPHDPYHLPSDWPLSSNGAYAAGWDELRKSRLAKQIELGLMPKGTELAARMPGIPEFNSLPPAARALAVKRMELYAGMVENFDHHVGRLIDYLKSIGEFDNTLILVLSDNGAEGTDVLRLLAGAPGSPNQRFAAEFWGKASPDDWGKPGSYVTYGPMWAQVSMTPFSQLKGSMAEGGIRSPLIVHGASMRRASGSINDSVMHVTDITPTLLDIARIQYPKKDRLGARLPSLQGKSWTDLLANKKRSTRSPTEYVAWELFGNRSIRAGDWKLRWQIPPFGKGDWELFNLKTDLAERVDLARENPEQLARIIGFWNDYVRTNNIVLPNLTVFDFMRAAQSGSSLSDPSFPPIFNFRQFIPPEEMVADPK